MKFSELAELNLQRCMRWHKGGINEWDISKWALAMCGEAGEVANAVKKVNRALDGMQQKAGPQTLEDALNAVAKEIGDTAIYLDLLAQRINWRLQDCVLKAFNGVSEREGFPERLQESAPWANAEAFLRSMHLATQERFYMILVSGDRASLNQLGAQFLEGDTETRDISPIYDTLTN